MDPQSFASRIRIKRRHIRTAAEFEEFVRGKSVAEIKAQLAVGNFFMGQAEVAAVTWVEAQQARSAKRAERRADLALIVAVCALATSALPHIMKLLQ